jgi:hypothetical protein
VNGAGGARCESAQSPLPGASLAQFWATMADESGDGGGSSMATLLRDKLVGSDLEPLHVELTE